MNSNERTLPDHTATVVLVRVQKSSFLGLGSRAITCSGGILGRPGVVASLLADAVGKYIVF